MATEKMGLYKSAGIDQVQEELIKQGLGYFFLRSIQLLFLYGIRRNCLRIGKSRSLYLSLKKSQNRIY